MNSEIHKIQRELARIDSIRDHRRLSKGLRVRRRQLKVLLKNAHAQERNVGSRWGDPSLDLAPKGRSLKQLRKEIGKIIDRIEKEEERKKHPQKFDPPADEPAPEDRPRKPIQRRQKGPRMNGVSPDLKQQREAYLAALRAARAARQ